MQSMAQAFSLQGHLSQVYIKFLLYLQSTLDEHHRQHLQLALLSKLWEPKTSQILLSIQLILLQKISQLNCATQML